MAFKRQGFRKNYQENLRKDFRHVLVIFVMLLAIAGACCCHWLRSVFQQNTLRRSEKNNFCFLCSKTKHLDSLIRPRWDSTKSIETLLSIARTKNEDRKIFTDLLDLMTTYVFEKYMHKSDVCWRNNNEKCRSNIAETSPESY